MKVKAEVTLSAYGALKESVTLTATRNTIRDAAEALQGQLSTIAVICCEPAHRAEVSGIQLSWTARDMAKMVRNRACRVSWTGRARIVHASLQKV